MSTSEGGVGIGQPVSNSWPINACGRERSGSKAELREMERLCLDWANDADLVLAHDRLIALAAAYGAAADAFGSSLMSC